MKQDDFNCRWLTPLITFEQYGNDWEKYRKKLYEIFIRDFIKNNLYFENRKVQIRVNPKENGFEHAFIHLTCESLDKTGDPNNRIPDFRRCERLEWNREIIENYLCSDNCKKCRKILYYEHYYKNHVRVNLVFADARFKVILEKRDKYILLITGYYIKYDYMLNKEINRAKLFEKQKTPLD